AELVSAARIDAARTSAASGRVNIMIPPNAFLLSPLCSSFPGEFLCAKAPQAHSRGRRARHSHFAAARAAIPRKQLPGSFGLGAQRKTPAEIVDKLNKEINAGHLEAGEPLHIAREINACSHAPPEVGK